VTDELDDTIEANAGGAQEARNDEGSFTQHPLRDVIDADRYLSAKRVAKAGKSGLRFIPIKPPGTV